MTKSKQKSTDPKTDAGLDYRQLAEQMLGSWQDQWRQLANNKDNPFANSYGDWMSSWSNAMTAWTNPMQQPAATPAPATNPMANQTAPFTESAHAKPAAPERTGTATTAPTGNPAAAQTVPPTAAPASNARDVLLTELARRVEFLHERVVTLESELEKLRAGK